MGPTKRKRKAPASIGRYLGPLSEPIYEPIVGLLAEIMRPAAEKRARQQQFLKLKALFVFYKIDETGPNAWRSLAIALALVHVPGMQIIHDLKKRRGRKRSWKAGLGIELVRDVEAVRAKRSINTEEAIRALMKDKAKAWHVYSEENLITRHREARRAEQKRRIMAEQLLASPTSQVMGGLFGISPEKTDGIK